MRATTKYLFAAALVAAPFTMPGAASALPVQGAVALQQSAPQDLVEQVQWRRDNRRGWNNRWDRRDRRSYRRGYGGVGAGFAAGAIIGGAIAAQQAQASANVHTYCSQRFRSYDPRSGTYLGYDGLRHACP